MAQITDHAVLRYLERVKGVDIAAIRREMTSAALEAVSTLGGTADVRMPCGARLRVINGAVVTVVPPHKPMKVRTGKPKEAA